MVNNSIDNYNIFDLLGLGGLSEDEKRRLLLDMNEIIWFEFLFTRLDKILTETELNQVKEMVERQEEVNKIVEFIESEVPNFSELLMEYSRKAKIEFIKRQLDGVIDQLNRVMPVNKAKLDKFTKAKLLVDQSNWAELYALMH